MTGLTSNPEVLRVLSMVALGLCCGILWDFFRAFSLVFSWCGWKRACADLAFWLTSIALLLSYLYTTPEFGWRLYDMAILFLGAIIYFSWFSHPALYLLEAIAKLLHRLLLAMKKLLDFLISILVALLAMLIAPLRWISRALFQGLRWLLRKLFPPPPPQDLEPPLDEE